MKRVIPLSGGEGRGEGGVGGVGGVGGGVGGLVGVGWRVLGPVLVVVTV